MTDNGWGAALLAGMVLLGLIVWKLSVWLLWRIEKNFFYRSVGYFLETKPGERRPSKQLRKK